MLIHHQIIHAERHTKKQNFQAVEIAQWSTPEAWHYFISQEDAGATCNPKARGAVGGLRGKLTS